VSATDPADLGVVEAAALLAERALSATELTGACLARIRERDGSHSHEGDPRSVNAWVRVYEEDALETAAMIDQARQGPAPLPSLAGVPIGLKDLYAVAGKPLTASSRLLDDRPERDCDVWGTLRSQGMILLGHLHTHEFAVGGTTDQVGNPWALDRSAGGSSGGSAAALAARMVPVATGTDTAGSLRIPSALSGTSTIKPTRGLVSLRGVVPLATSLDHAGPMARTLEDCALLLAAMPTTDMGRPASSLTGRPPEDLAPRRTGPKPLAGVRMAVSRRTDGLDPDVADGLDAAIAHCKALGAELLALPPPPVELEIGDDFLDVLSPELLAYHRRFDGRRDLYRASLREWIDGAEARSVPAERYVAAQARRRELTAAFTMWLVEHRISALIEATVPCVAPLRGEGYDHAGSDYALISLTHTWDWTGSPVVALPSGVGSRSGLPVGISLIGRAGTDWHLLDIGIQLQTALGVPAP
jgi:aspartyl-tRNA(Asn)/glutamyl-tRNA(Gln) amidotransferase subunit A